MSVNLNTVLQSSITTIQPFAKTALSIAVAQYIFARSRYFQDHISKTTGIPSNRISDLRRALAVFVTPQILIALVYKKKDDSLISFFKKNQLLVAITVFNFIKYVEPFRTVFKNTTNKFAIPETFYKFSKKFYKLYEPIYNKFRIIETNKFKVIYNGDIIPPILEEFIFRGLIQEGIMRQIPKFICKSMNISSAPIDHPISCTIRIATSAIIFGIAHLKKHKNDSCKAIEIGFDSLGLAYQSEYLGMAKAILCHYNDNLYAHLSKLL